MLNLRLKPFINYIARTFGLEPVGEVRRGWNISDYKFHSRFLPRENNEKGDPYFKPFEIDISSVTTRVGFSFLEDGWHPFVQTLKEYSENPHLRYRDSTLAVLFEKFRPLSVQEVLLDNLTIPVKPLCDLPPENAILSRLWELNQFSLTRFLDQKELKKEPVGWIYYGPHDEAYGAKEFERLTGIYNSIRKYGYRSAAKSSEALNGYFLKEGEELRFVLLHGNHRVSALKALGYSKIKVVIRKGHPAVVNRKELRKWTYEKGGIYSQDLAEKLFDSLFYGSGREKAKRLGLFNEAPAEKAFKQDFTF